MNESTTVLTVDPASCSGPKTGWVDGVRQRSRTKSTPWGLVERGGLRRGGEGSV
jgi:hypothetical protein